MKSTGENCRRCLAKRPDNAHRFSDDSYSFDYWGISNLAENPQRYLATAKENTSRSDLPRLGY
jgi:hypothetical protein